MVTPNLIWFTNVQINFGQMKVSIKMIGPILEDEGMHTFEYWGGEYRPLAEVEKLIKGE